MKYGPIFWGGMGGVLPNVVQKAEQLVNSSPGDTLDAIIYPTFLLGVALVACIGAIIVAAFREEDSRKALFLGIGAPALIMVIASAPGKDAQSSNQRAVTTPVTQGQTWVPWLMNAAHADPVKQARPAPVPENNLVPGRYVEVIATGESEPFNIDFLSDKGELINSVSLPSVGFGKLPLPPNAVSLRFSKGDALSSVYTLPLTKDKTKEFLVDVTGERAYGFWTAFGAAPQITYKFDVTEDYTKPADPGTEGWAYAGKFENSKWLGQFFDFVDNKLPAAGDKVKVLYPVNLRMDGNKDSKWVGELRLGQEVEISSFVTADQLNYWIKLKVLK
jgi:hypothetical protein